MVSVEVTNLEAAYLKIVESESKLQTQSRKPSAKINSSEAGDELLLQSNEMQSDVDMREVEAFIKTEGNPTALGQIKAVYIRRLLIFLREPRQWFLILSPMGNVIVIIMILISFFKLILSYSAL